MRITFYVPHEQWLTHTDWYPDEAYTAENDRLRTLLRELCFTLTSYPK